MMGVKYDRVMHQTFSGVSTNILNVASTMLPVASTLWRVWTGPYFYTRQMQTVEGAYMSGTIVQRSGRLSLG